jgi:hypothetical protein
MKALDLEKLQSLTLSGEKITKEIFEALFINNSPYYFSNQQSAIYPYDVNTPMPFEDSAVATSHQHPVGENFNMRNYEIFRGAFDAAANCGKIATTTTAIPNDYQYCENRFYQGQNYFQSF